MAYTPEKWSVIENLARELGASDEQIRKWKERDGVSARWHVKLIKASDGKLTVDDFHADERVA